MKIAIISKIAWIHHAYYLKHVHGERERDRKKFTIRMLNSNLIILLWCYHVLDTVAVVIVVAVARCNRRTDFINLDMNERLTRQIYCSNENLSHNLCNVLCKMKSRWLSICTRCCSEYGTCIDVFERCQVYRRRVSSIHCASIHFHCGTHFKGFFADCILILNFLAWLHFLMEHQLTHS